MPRPKGTVWSDGLAVLRPFPFEPVWELLLARHGSTVETIRALGWSGGRLKILRERERLTFYEADKLALAAGKHPSEIWGPLWHPEDELGSMFELLRQREAG